MRHEIADEVVHALDLLIDYYGEDEERDYLETNDLEYATTVDPGHIWHSLKLIDHWLAIVMTEKIAAIAETETAAA